MRQMALTGSYQHTIDGKGRLFIPAKLREELGDVFYLAMGLDGCLAIYPEETWSGFAAKLSDLPTAQTRALRTFFAHAVKCEPDSQGRILIPQKLRQYAGLKKELTINGMQNRAEIWDTGRWNEMEDLSTESLLSVMKALGL